MPGNQRGGARPDADLPIVRQRAAAVESSRGKKVSVREMKGAEPDQTRNDSKI